MSQPDFFQTDDTAFSWNSIFMPFSWLLSLHGVSVTSAFFSSRMSFISILFLLREFIQGKTFRS
ncbi:hypothetical protein, partial [Acetobacter sp.]|uniref:hypothetical protein n=1 Tax=Acetobacter sp. TaxID=440 RepID=UPI0039EA8A5E